MTAVVAVLVGIVAGTLALALVYVGNPDGEISNVGLRMFGAVVIGLVSSMAANVVAVDPSVVDIRVVRWVMAGYSPLALAISGHLLLRMLGQDQPQRRPVSDGEEAPSSEAQDDAMRTETRRPAAGRRRASFDDFISAATELVAEDQPVNRTVITRRLRAQGLSLSNERADLYLAQLEAEGLGDGGT